MIGPKLFIKSILLALKRPVLKILYKNNIGKGVEVCRGTYLTHSIIGDYCYLGMYSYFNHVKMGSYCSIAGNVTIGAMEHSHWAYSMSSYLSDEGYDNHETEIGNDVWIGTHCIIRQGVKIGDGAVIGANSFVNKDIPPFAIAFGTPAKVYKYRFQENVMNLLKDSGYWFKDPIEAKAILENIRENGNN